MIDAIKSLFPTTFVVCPLPCVSSSRKTSPALKVRFSPSPATISIVPWRQQKYCFLGAGCQSPNQPWGIWKKTICEVAMYSERPTGGAGGAKLVDLKSRFSSLK